MRAVMIPRSSLLLGARLSHMHSSVAAGSLQAVLNLEELPPRALAQQWKSIVYSPWCHQDEQLLHLPFYLRTNELGEPREHDGDRRVSHEGLADKPELMPLHQWFGNENPICMEVGSGFGEWVVGRAVQEPHKNWVAVEKRGNRVLSILRRLTAAGISNVRVISSDVQGYMNAFVPDQTISQVFVNYPDPWPKKKHAKRRLMRVPGFCHKDPCEASMAKPLHSDHFVQLLAHKLVPGGECHTVTDSNAMNEEMKLAFQKYVSGTSGDPLYTTQLAEPYHAAGTPHDYGITAYQTVWRTQGRPEHYMCWRTPHDVTHVLEDGHPMKQH